MAKYRREDGNNAGNAIKQRQYLGAAALVQRIAQNGKGDDVAASRADPLDKATNQKMRAVMRLRAQQRGQYEGDGAENRDRFTPGFIRRSPGKKHRGSHAG